MDLLCTRIIHDPTKQVISGKNKRSRSTQIRLVWPTSVWSFRPSGLSTAVSAFCLMHHRSIGDGTQLLDSPSTSNRNTKLRIKLDRATKMSLQTLSRGLGRFALSNAHVVHRFVPNVLRSTPLGIRTFASKKVLPKLFCSRFFSCSDTNVCFVLC